MDASSENHHSQTISFTCAFVNVTGYHDYQELAFNISACTLNVLFAFSAIVFNGIVIFVIWKTRSLHTPSNILLCGLAVSDHSLSRVRGSALYLYLRYKAIVASKRTIICLACSWILSSAWALSRFCLNVRSFATTTGSVIIICLLIDTLAYVQVFRLVKRHKNSDRK